MTAVLDLRRTKARMATSMDADSEVLFKEKREEKGVKAETAVDYATIRFDFRASTPATPPPGRGTEEGLWYLGTDASDVGTGAVLSQIQDGEEHVIAYVSKSLEGSKQRYCTARKELLAVVRALKHFKCYLYG